MKEFNIKNLTINFFKQRKGSLLLYIILTLSYPLGNIVVPHYYGKLIEQIVAKKIDTVTVSNTAITWIISIIGMYILTTIDNVIIPDFRSYLYKSIAKFIFETYKENYTNLKIGEIISKLSKLPFLILEVFYQIRNNYFPLFYMVLFSLIYFFSINIKLGYIVMSVIMLFMYVMYLSVHTCMPSCVNCESHTDSSNEDLQDILENILNVYTCDNIEEELYEFELKDKETSRHFKSCLSCASKHKLYFSLLYIVSFFIIAKFVYELYKENKITLSQINSIFIILIYLLSEIDTTLQYSQDTISYIGSIIDIQNYINHIKESVSVSNLNILNINKNLYLENIERLEGKIEFKNVNICFNKNGQDVCILKDFSYVIQPQTKLAITGMVGKGKSTLLKMILKLTYPSNGEILLDDMNLPYDVIRKNISYIPQTPILFNRKLYKNIVYGTKSTKEDVIHLMKKYNLNGVFGKHDLEDDVGKGGGNLSGGQKQVVIILRSILRNSSIILLDEPTSSLDKKLKNIIMELIFDVFKDKTVLIITHDEDILPLFKDVLNITD
jgi:ABC-type multidrug transport system fused ATPase/permease subunit